MPPPETPRTILASALCDSVNGAGSWECLPPSGGRVAWLHRADVVIHELAARSYMVIAIEETDGGR